MVPPLGLSLTPSPQPLSWGNPGSAYEWNTYIDTMSCWHFCSLYPRMVSPLFCQCKYLHFTLDTVSLSIDYIFHRKWNLRLSGSTASGKFCSGNERWSSTGCNSIAVGVPGFITTHQRSCGKVMFSVVSVCLSTGWVPCVHYPWCIGPHHTGTPPHTHRQGPAP